MTREPQRFSIQIDPKGPDDWTWTITCERCNADLSGAYGIPPIQVLNLKGNISPKHFEAFQRQWNAMVQNIRDVPARTILMNAEVDVHGGTR